MPSQRLKAAGAASYLTSGGGAKAVMGILLYLLLLLDAFSATRIGRGGVLLYLLLLLDAFSAVRVCRGGVLSDVWRRRKGRHGRPTLSSAAGCLHND